MILSYLLLVLLSSDCQGMAEIREKYDQLETESQIESFIDMCKETSCNSAIAYKDVATMQLAEHTFLPNRQLGYFRKGKAVLDQHIAENPADLEARYLRILVQLNVPSFIDYRDDFESDYAYLKKEIGSSSLPEAFQSRILNRIKNELNE